MSSQEEDFVLDPESIEMDEETGIATLICTSSILESEDGLTDCSRPINESGLSKSSVSRIEAVEKGVESLCMVCLQKATSMPSFRSSSGTERQEEAETIKITLSGFCKLLKVTLSKSKLTAVENVESPLCGSCRESLVEINTLAARLEELECSIDATRALIRNKVLSCPKQYKDVPKDEIESAFLDYTATINDIRNSIKADQDNSFLNKKRRKRQDVKTKKKGIGKHKTDEEAVSPKSSFGRPVKRPRYLLSEDESEEEIQETKFNPLILSQQIKNEIVSGSGETFGDKLKEFVGSKDVETSLPNQKQEPESASTGNDFNKDALDDTNDNLEKTNTNNGKRKKTKSSVGSRKQLVSKVKTALNIRKNNKQSRTLVKLGIANDEHKLKCKKCSRTFPNRAKMERHMLNVHEGKADYGCKSCNKKFSKLIDLIQHRTIEHNIKHVDEGGRKLFECEFCPMVFKNLSDILIHRRHHTGERPFQCEICKEGFISKGRYEVHVEVVHPDRAPLKCEFCPRSFFRHHRLRDHKNSHTGERPYLCEICSKAFSQPAYLKYHQTQHKELNLAEFKCNECDKKFASPVNLRYHKETQHQKLYRYHCDVCGHGTTHMSHMKLHMRSHTGERPHSCPYCSKSFARGSQLKIHIRAHTGERPYACKICGKTFTNNSKVRRHEMTHNAKKFKKSRNVPKSSQITTIQPESQEILNSSYGNASFIPEQLVDVQIEQDNNGIPVLKVERAQLNGLKQEEMHQLITIEQPNNVTYQLITPNEIVNDVYAEYVVLNGDFTVT